MSTNIQRTNAGRLAARAYEGLTPLESAFVKNCTISLLNEDERNAFIGPGDDIACAMLVLISREWFNSEPEAVRERAIAEAFR